MVGTVRAVTYYLAHGGSEDDFFGVPFPSVGARVVFNIERLFAARIRTGGWSNPREVVGDEGLVVHEDPMAVLVMPDRLWRVDDLDGEIRLAPNNRWLRCRALTVRQELPTWLVMGPRGNLVAQVIDQARNLTDPQAKALATMDAAEEERLVGAMWDAWLPTHRSGSPIGHGLNDVHYAVEEAARRMGPHLFGWDEQAGLEVLVDPTWQQAAHAANAAALGLGAPELLGDQGSQGLARRWITVIGAPTPP